MMEGILPPTAGEVLFRGEPIGESFRAQIGIQFQATALQDFLNVGETLRLFQKLSGPTRDLTDTIREYALGDILRRDTRKLSGGERQRLLLAIAVVNEPDLLFLDEPTTGLDPQARREFWRLIEHLKTRGTSIVLTTHNMDEAYELCDSVVIMNHGKIVAEGHPKELLSHHYEEVVLQIPTRDFSRDLYASFSRGVRARSALVEITTDNVNETLRTLVDSNVSLNELRIRAHDLEDLFLELTGRELRP
jgi:ABC-2 type transport system ATP-binding protein